MAGMVLSAGSMRRYCICETREYYIYIIYTPNLGLEIAVPGREREQGRFRESTEGARGRSGGVSREHEGASREHGGASTEHGESL